MPNQEKDLFTPTTSTPVLEIVEENNYYPFGLQHQGYNEGMSPTGNSVGQRYRFGGKELTEALGLDTYDPPAGRAGFGARNYDAALGRWMNVDPLAEHMRRHSPYNYAFNNPVYFIDPDGMEPMDWIRNNDSGVVKWYDSRNNDGDVAIKAAAMNDRLLNPAQKLTEYVKIKYTNLAAGYFTTKGENLSDEVQILDHQDQYLTDVTSAAPS